MGASVGDLEQRQIERWRVEIAEALAARLAYPPFFDFRTGRELVRPVDRAKREELDQFVHSINFSPLERMDVSSTEVRRFLEQLLLRYIEVNPALRRPWVTRRLSSLRTRVPRLAAAIHRDLLVYLSGGAAGFGARRQQQSWMGRGGGAGRDREEVEHNTRVLEAVLTRNEASYTPPPVVSPPPVASSPPPRPPAPAAAHGPGGQRQPPAAASDFSAWSGTTTDATVPIPSQTGPGAPNQSPFATLAAGAQSAMFGAKGGISESPTSPLIGMPPSAAGGRGSVTGGPPQAGVRALPEDLYQLYGDYLRDMQPEAFGNGRLPPSTPPPPSPQPPPAPRGAGWAPGPSAAAPPAPLGPRLSPPPAQPPAGAFPPPKTETSTNPHGDQMIFFQLRYQLEAYIRRAARSYGVQTRSDDPSGVLDALRRSRHVDEADLRLAEGILALTDRVAAAGGATLEDYRQALMLYLLYHRSHLGG